MISSLLILKGRLDLRPGCRTIDGKASVLGSGPSLRNDKHTMHSQLEGPTTRNRWGKKGSELG